MVTGQEEKMIEHFGEKAGKALSAHKDRIMELEAERNVYKAMLERCGVDPATGEPVVHGVTATQAETDEYEAMLKKHKERVKADA